MNISENIKIAMEQAGLSVDELSKRMGSQKQNVRNWLKGTSMRIDTLTKFCQALGCSADFLLGLPDPEHEPTRAPAQEAAPVKVPEERFSGNANLGDPDQLVRRLRRDAKEIRESMDRNACHIWQAARHCEAAADWIEEYVIGGRHIPPESEGEE